MTLQEKIDAAWSLKKRGDIQGALKLYLEIHDQLVDEAAEYARSVPGTRVDEGSTRRIMPAFFEEADRHLRRDVVFSIILNNMGTIYAESGDRESARRCFEDAIKHTPEGVDYPHPGLGLEALGSPTERR